MRNRVLVLVVLPAALLLWCGVAAGMPRFPGAKRVADPHGRFYVAVEQRSDRWALVERADPSKPLPALVDGGFGRFGLPGPEPVLAGDRVIARGRLSGYPKHLLVASDGSGFVAVTITYGRDYKINEVLHWVPAAGPRVVLATYPSQFVPRYPGQTGTTWAPMAFSTEQARVAFRGHEGLLRVFRLSDSQATDYDSTQNGALAVEYNDAEPPRLDHALRAFRSRSDEALEQIVATAPGHVGLAAALILGARASPATQRFVRRALTGEPALQLTARERIRLILNSEASLGAGAGPALLPLLIKAKAGDENVRRAVFWKLGQHTRAGRPLVRRVLADPTQPTAVREACAWLLARHGGPRPWRALLAAAADKNAGVAAAAVEAIADRRWAAGPTLLTLLKQRGVHAARVAAFLGSHVIPGATPALIEALRRAPKGAPVRKRYVAALRVQTLLRDLGDDPAAWAAAIRTRRKK